MKIAVVMSVAGDSMYFKLATKSIPSFLRNNTADLYVFTDNMLRIEKLRNAMTGRLHIVDYNRLFWDNRRIIKKLEQEGLPAEAFESRTQKIGHVHNHILVSALPPLAEKYLTEMDYDFILKIDADSFFAGGDMLLELRSDLLKTPDCDLYLVARTAPKIRDPGTGFVLWRKGGPFVKTYLQFFSRYRKFQPAIQAVARKGIVKTHILKRPGYHFICPFNIKGMTKERLRKELPAYFHLAERHALERIRTLEGWFG